MLIKVIAAALLTASLAVPAVAGGYRTVEWSDLKAEIYGARAVEPALGQVVLEAPTRSPDDRRVPIEVAARMRDGTAIRSVTLIIDENPMPVSAVFEFPEAREAVRLGVDMRLNGPSPVRAVIETVDGRLLMAERLVKTSGLGACAAPPMGDPDAAIAGIGEMRAKVLGVETAAISGDARVSNGTSSSAAGPAGPMVELAMKHPQHTGLQMDQITLLFIQARYVHELEVADGGDVPLFHLTGSISLSEDPALRFELGDVTADRIDVRYTDTAGTKVTRTLFVGFEG
ncbi:MAG: quinoprotein dehydrogenase-associated SoxYZ-like carrier [Pseudomonadota bacterium]